MPAKSFNKVMVVISVFFVLACSTLVPRSTPPAASIEREEQIVYSFFVDVKGPALILQDTSTGISEMSPTELRQTLKSSFKNVSKETIDSYLSRNEQPDQLLPDMNLGVDYTLLSAGELAKISSQPNWGELLAQKYPGSRGYTIFSRVGFNSTLDQAVIYVGKVAGPLMGSGFYYLLEKKDGKWILKEQNNIWIS